VLQRVGDIGVDPEMSRRCGDGSDGAAALRWGWHRDGWAAARRYWGARG
jgi:hypothetical protein